MSDDSARPLKRARLDDNATSNANSASILPVPTAASSAPTPASATIDDDVAREVRAGITEYVCPNNLGFTGVLKQRYTDFLVNEIGLDGQVLRLNSIRLEKVGDKEETRKEVSSGEKNGDGEKVAVEENKEKMDNVHNPNGTAIPSKVDEASTQNPLQNEEAPAQQQTMKQEPEIQLSDEDRKTLDTIFGEETRNHIVTLVRQIRRHEHKKAKDFKAVTTQPMTDKETRTQAHKCLRRLFPNLLESVMEEDQSIRIKASPPAERKGKKKTNSGDRDQNHAGSGRQRGQPAWEELGGEYLHFSLYKENKDTMEIVAFIGSKLKCGSKGFGFAGTKDRRACTVQRVCVKRQTAERMQMFNKTLYNAAIGDFKYCHGNLKLGDLMGNEFTITLRDCHFQNEEGLDMTQRCKLANEVLEKAVKDFSEKGFISYYGLQRFGSFAASTDAIGRKILQNDLKGAVDDLLAYSDIALAAAQGTLGDPSLLVSQDDRNRAQGLHIWKTKGSGSEALDILPRKYTAERNIVQHLSSRNSKTGRRDRASDWQGALMTIPRNLRLMYVHAYQSLVWNTVAGKRWSTYGDTVVEGDLILENEHGDKETNKEAAKTTHQDQDGEFIINPTGSENANATEEEFERARPLSASEASSGNYSIWDIVLPQPGYDVEYPKNEMGECYKEFMGSEKGGGLDPHNMRRPWREASLSGSYRKFLSRPLQPLTFQVHQYTKDDEQFVETDLEQLKRETENDAESKQDVEMEDGEEQRPKEEKIAVVITLQLASSQYATMALRELMKAGGAKAYKPEFMGGR